MAQKHSIKINRYANVQPVYRRLTMNTNGAREALKYATFSTENSSAGTIVLKKYSCKNFDDKRLLSACLKTALRT